MGFILRWVCAFGLLAATFNPTDWNYLNWVRTGSSENLSVAVLAGLVLAIGYIIYLRATLRSIGGGRHDAGAGRCRRDNLGGL